MARTAKSPIPSFPVVAIGASAGGLEPTSELLANIPLDSGMAFVVVHHLAEGTPSLLRDILARVTKLPVATVEDRLSVEPDHVYVMPETADLEIDDHHLSLVPRLSAGSHLPIDQFFASLAKSQGHYAVGVVLSGAGSDGTKGLREIKSRGGWAFLQIQPDRLERRQGADGHDPVLMGRPQEELPVEHLGQFADADIRFSHALESHQFLQLRVVSHTGAFDGRQH